MANKLFKKSTPEELIEDKKLFLIIGFIISSIIACISLPYLGLFALGITGDGNPWDYLMVLAPIIWEGFWLAMILFFVLSYRKTILKNKP